MASLFNQIQAIEGKKPFQTYTIQHGIEHLRVLVPVANVKTFESAFKELKDKQKSTILQLVEQVGGKVKG